MLSWQFPFDLIKVLKICQLPGSRKTPCKYTLIYPLMRLNSLWKISAVLQHWTHKIKWFFFTFLIFPYFQERNSHENFLLVQLLRICRIILIFMEFIPNFWRDLRHKVGLYKLNLTHNKYLVSNQIYAGTKSYMYAIQI